MSEREDAVSKIFEEPLPTVAFVQYGPDGTTAVNAVTMYVCPMDGDVIPIPLEEKPEWQFPQWHIDHHLAQARMQDTLDALSQEVRDLKRMLGKSTSVPTFGSDDQRGGRA